VKNENCFIKIFNSESGTPEELQTRAQAWLNQQTRIEIVGINTSEVMAMNSKDEIVWGVTIIYHYYILGGKGERK